MKKKFVSALMGLLLTATAVTAIPAVTAEAAAWQKNSVGWWWQKDDGSYPANSWQFINGKWYAFDQNGYMRHGWFWDDSTSNWYYLGSAEDGSMKTGWQYVDGAWYYMDSSGAMLKGWQTINGKTYFFNSSGAMQSDWFWDDSASDWYYFGSAGDGSMKTGWQYVNGAWYYMYEDGKMASDTWIDQYYVNSSGAWTKTKEPAKWIQSGGRWWYRHEDGGYTTNGFETIGGKTYYFDASGWMVTGWQFINSTWYYFDASGAMLTNTWVGSYYVGEDGKMLTDTWIDGYYVGPDGAWIPDYEEQHQHSYDEGIVTKEPTCTNPGERTYTCSICGHSYTEEIAVVDHKWVHHDAVTHEEIITPAWDEKVAIWKVVCNGCGAQFDNAHEAGLHVAADFGDECSSTHNEIVGYDTIHHEAVTETVVDVPAYDECSVCHTTR